MEENILELIAKAAAQGVATIAAGDTPLSSVSELTGNLTPSEADADSSGFTVMLLDGREYIVLVQEL